MDYDEITVGQRVEIVTTSHRFRDKGTVRAKEIVDVAGRPTERVYIDADSGRRRMIHPSILAEVDD